MCFAERSGPDTDSLRAGIMEMQNRAIVRMVTQLRGMAGERALIGDLAAALAEDSEFAPWSGERFVTASAIRVIRSLRDRDESEIERDEAAARLFDCMAEDKQALFVEDMYVEEDAVHYIGYLRSKIADLEGQIKELSNTKPSGPHKCQCDQHQAAGEASAPKLRPERWWIS